MNFGAVIAPLLVKTVYEKDIESLYKHLVNIKANSEIIYISVYSEYGMILEKQIADNYRDLFILASEKRLYENPIKIELKEIGKPQGFFLYQGQKKLLPRHQPTPDQVK